MVKELKDGSPQGGGLAKSRSLTSLVSKRSAASSQSEKLGASGHKAGHKRKRRGFLGFMKKNKSDEDELDDDEDDEEDSNIIISDMHGSTETDEENDEDDDNEQEDRSLLRVPKRRKVGETPSQDEEEALARLAEFEKEEKARDEELAPEYRKFRARGFKFNPPPTDRPVRVYADGVFDLFHVGHMRQLEQAKKALPNVTLICGVPSDVETHRRKGLTVLTDVQRCETLKHCKWVDEVIPDAPWAVTPEFLDLHKIDYVAHDDLPYASGDSDDIYRPIKEQGKFLTTQRTEGISTSDIITKVIRDYDKYLMRNFARGASRQELNVSWFKKNELDLKRHVMEFRESFKTNFETASKDLYSEIRAYISSTLGNSGNHHHGSMNSSGTSSSGTASGVVTPRRPRSPVTDYAANFSGGEERMRRQQKQQRPTSFIGNVKGWMTRKSVPASPSRE